jgi:hypothetical protein
LDNGGLLDESVLLVRVQGAKNQIEINLAHWVMRIGFMLDTEPHRRPIHAGENFVFCHLQPLCHCRLNNRSIWQQDHEVKLPECTLDRVGEANQPKWNGHCPKFLRFQCSNLYVIKRWS